MGHDLWGEGEPRSATASLFGLDYDETYTADPTLWQQFIGLARRRGHAFVCVTGRKLPPGIDEPPLPACVPIVCADGAYKREAALKAGYKVTIWIDDMPEMIAPSLILDWSEGLGSSPRASALPASAVRLPAAPSTLPQSLLSLIGEYGMARTDGVSEVERLHRWQQLIEGIKAYARAPACVANSEQPEHPVQG